MQTTKTYTALLCWLLPTLGLAQRIDNLVSFRQIDQPSFSRLHYDNDFFTGTDYYYTQGYMLEIVKPGLQKNPLTKLLIKARSNQIQYGLAFEHLGFTPTSIRSQTTLIGDRPFAADLSLKTFSLSTDTLRRVRVSAGLSMGMMGPVALGSQIQTALHRLFNGVEPKGWQYQIHNDVILTYTLHYEKQLYAYRQDLSISTTAQAQVGTHIDRLQTGIVVMAGRFNSPFGPMLAPCRLPLQVYIYAQPLVSVVGYDASLQGGLFNSSSPYVLSVHQLARVTFQGNFGVVFRYKTLYMEYAESILSREFSSGLSHRWGGIKLGASFGSPHTK